ncbi:phosphoribosylformylglycinamidine (FGAM) synthase PurS component [Elusimicrobium posterum]|uniref:phosphoribosylformylglycinamidine synthase subunit PurS n=1 Tax=Elusimicrobium posterum TaxID=3116653 RepID=UPI003C749756
MIYFIETSYKKEYGEKKSTAVAKRLASVGLKGIENVECHTIYKIDADYTKTQAKEIAEKLLADPVLETYTFSPKTEKGAYKVEVWIRDSSTDVIAESVQDAIAFMGFTKPVVRCANAFNIKGSFTQAALEEAVKKTFVNEVVNKYSIVRG